MFSNEVSATVMLSSVLRGYKNIKVPSEFGLDVGEGSLVDVESGGKESSGLVVWVDSLVFSTSFKVEGVGDSGKELVKESDDAKRYKKWKILGDWTLIGKLVGLGGDGGEDLEDLGIWFSVDVLGGSSGGGQ